MGKIIEERRQSSDERFERLRESLTQALAICADVACVYATGSFGRREASEHSDIDLFIVSLSDYDKEKRVDRSRLSKLNEILLKAELIRASRELKFREFSQDGRFLTNHTARKLIESTGNQYDDAENTFTARLLLLLESRPLVGGEVHARVIDDVIARYWREFPDHYDRFMPTFLANDILRYWRTLCLNYEANTSEETSSDRAKRKIKNYKLKHSRMLTCYSAVLYLLFVYDRGGTITPEDAQTMTSLTPTARIEFVANELNGSKPSACICDLLDKYERFLNVTNASEDDLIKVFSEKGKADKLRDEQSDFGDLAYTIMNSIGHENRLYRRLVI
ncbi:MAG: nucleotidyltransferase domain-containing protein [Terracidiphilus sp.]|jgi:predicted nucleotidyltransferase